MSTTSASSARPGTPVPDATGPDAAVDHAAATAPDGTASPAGRTPAAPSSAATPAEPGGLDTDRLQELLLGRWAAVRREARENVKDPALHRIEGLSLAEHRDRVLGQLQLLVDLGAVQRAYPAALGGADDHGGNIAAFVELVTADPSLQIKSGVQWGLFGAAILHLGTRRHHEAWLPQAMSLELPGVFAMTEIGHGSDVASLGTTATYVPETDEFEIHTPFKAAWKDYLGNAALHGRAAVVFAQLITRGVNHGVHAFFVPLRDATGAFLPGVGGEDDGLKGGLNGIDNGRLHFDHVRVPRTHLLDRYGSVDAEGAYSSPIDSPGRRFFTMIGTLVQGRVSLALSGAAASALALKGAITYGNERRQFNASSETHEEVLLDYQLHQRRLIDRLARTYADALAANELLEKFDAVFSGEADTDDDRQELETLAAAIKPLATWNALDTLQECREACGGAGFMARNRFTSLRADLDVFVTFEGDNNVLLQLVGKRLLADYSRELSGFSVGALSRFVVAHATNAVVHRSGLRRVAQSVHDAGSERKSANWFKETDVQRALLEDRVRTKTGAVAQALLPVARRSRAEQAATFNRHQTELIDAARNHAELLEWEAFTRALESVEDPHTRQVLTWLRDLFALRVIEDDLGWFLENGRISPQRARTLRQYINRLAYRLRPHAQDLVDAWGYEPEHVRMDVATGEEARRQTEAAEYHRRQRASGDAPVPERSLRTASPRR
ncbi:acyl-CoA dehydrogenase [Citricoccus sp. SGAir0253]|uniref:acyl-CoA dehydrogenase family protein n=1 Tax=Citricoccus sp. SGAir0253 TaxID=2567881 RepID=UPI0010CCDD6F|nr:acyl-CoA dehydrogenase [Citricoccus sp. SGAir0253]QCU78075.1 acyl-CoA dehydrogenase [Citricoccus sp. SGAir0253]